MRSIRVILFIGLALHKLLWEVMKRNNGLPRRTAKPARSPFVRLLKICKLVALAFLLVQTLFLDLFPISRRSGPLRTVGMLFYLTGLATAVTGRLQLGENWADLEEYKALPGQSIVTRGVYRYIRHPIYAGDTLLLIGLQLALNSWLFLAVSILFVVVVRQSIREESLLSYVYPEYINYTMQTKRFIPFVV